MTLTFSNQDLAARRAGYEHDLLAMGAMFSMTLSELLADESEVGSEARLVYSDLRAVDRVLPTPLRGSSLEGRQARRACSPQALPKAMTQGLKPKRFPSKLLGLLLPLIGRP